MLLVIPGLLLSFPIAASDFKAQDAEFRTLVVDPYTPVLKRKGAISDMSDLGTGDSAESLLWAVTALDTTLGKDYAERARLDAEYAPFFTEKDWQKFDNPEKKKEELVKKIAVVDKRVVEHEAVLEALFRAILAQSAPDAVKVITGSSTLRHSNWRTRAFAGCAAATMKDVPVAGPLKLLKDSDERVRALVAEGFARRRDPETIPALGKILAKEKTWQVRAALIKAFGAIGDRKACRFLIERMGMESGRLLEDINAVLKALTGQNFQPDPPEWKRWYDENKAEIEGDDAAKGPRGNPRWKKRDAAGFYGLETYSQRIVFIIDCSGSMEDPMGRPGALTRREDDDEDEGVGPKIEIAKKELKRSIRSLDRESRFNIVSFNYEVKTWQPKMVAATQKNKNEAYVWVRALKPEASTYLYGALKVAFDLAGMGARDSGYEPEVDTIVLLSDGAPTDNTMAAKRMDTDFILKAVRGWNKLAKIKIHVIAIDEAKKIRFLRQLANENDGTYVAK
jgi:HEAT repeat protein